MKLALTVAVVVGALALTAGRAAASPAPVDGAAPFAARAAAELLSNRYGDAWRDLLPAHRGAVPRSLFVRCESETAVPGRILSIRVLAVAPARVRVPGVAEPAPSVGVRLAVVVAVDGARVQVAHTFHVIRSAGRWWWFLAADRFRAYAAGACPGAPLPAGPAI